MECKYCKSSRVVKNGTKHGAQNYLCRECGRAWTKTAPRHSADDEKRAVVLYCLGLSFKTIGKLMNYSKTSILYWVRNFARKNYAKPIPKGEIIVELDEMHHFIQSKKTNYGFGKYIAAQLDNLLTGNAEIAIPPLLKGCITE